MNKVLIISSFLCICCIHLLALNTIIEKKPIKINKPKYEKVSFQLVKVVKEKPKKIEKKIVKKKVVNKEIFKKPIKKKAKRQLVKKKIKKKKVVKKSLKKIVKKIEKKPIEKPLKKVMKPIKKTEVKKVVKNVANKNKASFLKKYKQFKVSYLTKLRSAIDRNKKYPRASVRLKEQGRVSVSFRIFKSGAIKNIRIVKSSGKKRLDKAALKAVHKTSNYLGFGKEINKEYMDIDLSIQFKLK